MHVRSPGPHTSIARALLMAAGIAIGPRMAASQTSVDRPPVPAFSALYLQTGTLLMDVGRLNPHLERLDLVSTSRPGYFTLSNDGYAIGVGAYGAVWGRLALGFEWNVADVGAESSPSGKTDQITTTYWMGTAGFAAFTRWRLNVLPFVGIGTGTAKLTLRDRAGGASLPGAGNPTFDDVVMAPGAESSMSGNYLIVQPGLAVDYLALRQDSDRLGVTFGIRLSRALSPNRTTWTYAGQSVFGGPDLGPTGGVMRVVIGIGGFRLAK